VLAGIEVDLRALLEGCASGGASAVAFDGGGNCDARDRVPVSVPRAEAVAAARARRTGRRTKALAPSNARKT
jgi:hypothetical protein